MISDVHDKSLSLSWLLCWLDLVRCAFTSLTAYPFRLLLFVAFGVSSWHTVDGRRALLIIVLHSVCLSWGGESRCAFPPRGRGYPRQLRVNNVYKHFNLTFPLVFLLTTPIGAADIKAAGGR